MVILGPTASGKSAAAIGLAKKFNGEIISADSRQVFRGMDIGTGKVDGSWDAGNGALVSEGVPHYAIDITDPNEDFNVTDFKKYAYRKIEEILSRGKLPIICGGTGFWISAVVDDLDFPEVAPDWKLREKLGQKSATELLSELKRIDPERAGSVDPHNKFRLIRAIEICQALGSVPKPKTQNLKPSPYEFLQIGIKTEKENLHLKIKKRLDERFELGMINEVKRLHLDGVSWERLEGFGLEYRRIAEYLQGKIPLESGMSAKGGCASGAKEKLYFDIVHYAKRQMTWFQKDKRIIWLKEYEEIENAVSDFIK